MTARVIWIELRRSAAPWAALAAILSQIAFPDVNAHAGWGLSTIAAGQRAMLQACLPVALLVGAWQARRERRFRVEELITTTSRPQWQRLLPIAAAMGIGAMAGSLAVTGGLAVYAATLGAYFSAAAMPYIAVTAIYTAVGVWFGLAIGRLLPLLLTPPLLFVAASLGYLTLLIFTDPDSQSGPRPGSDLLLPSMTGRFGQFYTLTDAVFTAQMVWVTALAAAALILYTAKRYLRLAAIVPVALGLAVALPMLPQYEFGGVVYDRGAMALVCTSEPPKICVRRAHHLTLDDMREPSRQALAILAAKLPQAPTSVSEYFTPSEDIDTQSKRDTIHVVVMDEGRGRVDATEHEILWSLLMGAGTQRCALSFGVDGNKYLTARVVAAAWLIGEEPLARHEGHEWFYWIPEQSLTLPAYRALLALPADEQRARVAALRESELACDNRNRLELLIG